MINDLCDLNPELHINKSNILNNYNISKSLSPKAKTFAVLKANAYGCGLNNIANILRDCADGFAVARWSEAIMLKTHSTIKQDILVLTGLYNKACYQQGLDLGIYSMIGNDYQLNHYIKEIKLYHKPIYLKINTGMNRFGFSLNEADLVINKLKRSGYQNIILMSHCSSALDQDSAHYTESQLKHINFLAEKHQCKFTIANSPTAFFYQQFDLGYINRIGTALYGHEINHSQLKPALALFAYILNIIHVKKGDYVGYSRGWQAPYNAKIAILNFGYGDGLTHFPKKGAYLLIKNTPCSILSLTMDTMLVDVTSCPETLSICDQIEIFGNHFSLESFSSAIGLSMDEILTQLSARVQRIIS
ncbi:alanine racemase [Piscirickettsia litoralis]|uniref:Alanine racemase n=1 Tax=Piscirickettsia litoralis TaxID=1891921 RepID=A0ABX3A4H4_9GAMM|nr:alanine racemase [Piscirickettsia litoralis]ODN42290.1 alanine racemase [Piscirickettsia litoralis]